MGTTANLGIEYPDPSGVPSRKTYVEDPIKSVDAKVVAYLGKRVKGGSSSGTIAIGQSSVTVDITFQTPFANVPAVDATPRSNFGYTATTATTPAPTVSGATIVLHRPAGAPTTAAAPVTFDWTATDLGNS